MRSAFRGAGFFVLSLGLLLGSGLSRDRELSAQGDKKDKKEDHHLHVALKQLIQAHKALDKAVEKEAKERKADKAVIRDLQKALKDVDKSIQLMRKAIKLNDD